MKRTKDIIVTAFWQLLDEKPYSQITVKDIVTRCQVNRNTFYYHFHDIPELVAYSLREDVDVIMKSGDRYASLSECVIPLIRYSQQRKRAILHLYRSVERELFLQLLEYLTLYVAGIYLDTVTSSIPFDITDSDKELLTHFYKSVLIGLSMDWLDHSMDYDLEAAVIRCRELFVSFDLQKFF